MKMNLLVFLTLCLGITPVFGQDIPASAETGVAVVKVETAETVLSGAEFHETSTPPAVSDLNAASTALPRAEPLLLESDSSQFSTLRAFGGMGLVLCLLAAAYLGVRKFAPGFFPKPSGAKNLKIIETLSMGDRRSLALVEVGGSRLLIGSTPQQINLLTALTEHFLPASENEEGEKRNVRNLFEVEKKRPVQYSGNMLPEEIRLKMRRLREALDR